MIFFLFSHASVLKILYGTHACIGYSTLGSITPLPSARAEILPCIVNAIPHLYGNELLLNLQFIHALSYIYIIVSDAKWQRKKESFRKIILNLDLPS